MRGRRAEGREGRRLEPQGTGMAGKGGDRVQLDQSIKITSCPRPRTLQGGTLSVSWEFQSLPAALPHVPSRPERLRHSHGHRGIGGSQKGDRILEGNGVLSPTGRRGAAGALPSPDLLGPCPSKGPGC